jgi:photosystem II stability/assembly factor-like uncharacterized protein
LNRSTSTHSTSLVTRLACLLAITSLLACGDDDTSPLDSGLPGEDAGADRDGGAPEDAGDGDDEDAGGELDGGTSSPWTLLAHPCVGNRTDTLWRDDDGTLFVGCGTTTEGDQGFHVSTDDGATWAAPTTTPAGFFSTWRVNDISRSADGFLYVAGIGTMSRRVVRVDTSATPWQLEETFNAGSTVGTAFTVGRFRRAADGSAIAESLTGTDVVYRANDDADWEAVGEWGDSFGGLQILDLAEHDGEFYGCGSTISQPPYLFLPDADPGFGFRVFDLAGDGIGAYVGEMWGLAVDASGLVVGGVDQNRDVGMIYARALSGTGAPTVTDVSTFYPDDPTWIRGICRDGANVLAVGELSRESEGIVLFSEDGGETFVDVTPESSPASPLPPLHECAFAGADEAFVAGANGALLVWRR